MWQTLPICRFFQGLDLLQFGATPMQTLYIFVAEPCRCGQAVGAACQYNLQYPEHETLIKEPEKCIQKFGNECISHLKCSGFFRKAPGRSLLHHSYNC
jgi:hypothetical protein